MQILSKPQRTTDSGNPIPPRRQRKRFSPQMLIGTGVTLAVVFAAGIYLGVIPYIKSHAANATPNPNCTIIVPANPLSAQGLATPYQLFAPDAAQNGPCNEANTNQSAFVQGVIFDPATGKFSVYSPLVIDKGTQPAAAPVVPTLPQGAIVGIWFGFNGTNLTLQAADNNTLQQANCVNGLNGSVFTQFAYCNAVAFFHAANKAIAAGQVKVPALATANDGQTCPTTRDFGIVDQDQSDNVQTQYLTTANGQTAQFSTTNQAALANATVLANPSDNALVTHFVNPPLGCTSWTAPDLANNNAPVASLALDEIQANADQKAPIALVPLSDPMTVITDANGNTTQSLQKTNLYRAGVDQPLAANTADASGKTYCQNLVTTGAPRIVLDAPLTAQAASPDTGAATTLFTFLAQRFAASYTNLGCQKLLNAPSPIQVTVDGNGVATSATFNGQPISTQPTTPPITTTTPNCNANGVAVAGCAGKATINGQACTFAFANNTVNLTCQAAPSTGTATGTGTDDNTTTTTQTTLPFNNDGISADGHGTTANFDLSGASYSEQTLLAAGFTPGKTITFNGVTFTWPNVVAGAADNVQAMGQVIPVTPVQGAKTLAFLGSSTNGPSLGNAVITYTDGSTQIFRLGLSDWTLGASKMAPSFGNQALATLPYRNTPNGVQANGNTPHIFYTSVALLAGKTIASVTLPSHVNAGHIHIFAISTK